MCVCVCGGGGGVLPESLRRRNSNAHSVYKGNVTTVKQTPKDSMNTKSTCSNSNIVASGDEVLEARIEGLNISRHL